MKKNLGEKLPPSCFQAGDGREVIRLQAMGITSLGPFVSPHFSSPASSSLCSEPTFQKPLSRTPQNLIRVVQTESFVVSQSAGSRSSIQRQIKQGFGACGSLPRSICFGSAEQTCCPVLHSQSTRFIVSGSHVPCWAMQRKSVWGCHDFCSSLKPRNLGEDPGESSWVMRPRGRRKCTNWSPKLRAPSFNLQGKLRCGRLCSARDFYGPTSMQLGFSGGVKKSFKGPRKLNIHKLGIRCAARKEEDGSTTEKGRGKEVDAKDHYRVLGLRRQATAPAIKTAFRQLARQYHPDVNKDVDADDKFKSIRRAYEVLSDEASRRLYDGTLQDQTNSSRRKQVYQRREARQRRDTRNRPGYNRPQYRRAAYETIEWDYSNFSYRNNQTNPESGCHPGSGTAAFKTNWTNSAAGNRSSKSSKREEFAPEDLAVEWRRMGKEAVLFLWVVSTMWHALGAQTALGLLVGSLALWRDFAVGYRVASGVAWLMGGEKGLAVAVALIATTRVFGKAYHTVAAILVLALWLGGSFLRAMPLPPGAILVMVYKCIRLQSSSA